MELNPKEKAEELVEKYEDALGHSDLNVCPTDDLDIETRATAIQCAIIVVDEIIKVNMSLLKLNLTDELGREIEFIINYWQEVKTHLNDMVK